MKNNILKLYQKLGLLALLLLLLSVLAVYLSVNPHTKAAVEKITDSSSYVMMDNGVGDVMSFIDQVRAEDKTSVLIIGDSVCRQMFSGLADHNPAHCIAATNATVTMPGQYILAGEYLDSHPNATDIYLITSAASLSSSYDMLYGYRYAVAPFVETDTLYRLDDDTIRIIEKTYGSFFVNPSVLHVMDTSGICGKLYSNITLKYFPGYEPEDTYELSDRYVCAIQDLCRERGVNFYLYPTPVSDFLEDYVSGFRAGYELSATYDINPDYFDEIYIFDDAWTEDKVHLAGEYANQETYNEIIMQAYADTPLLESMKFE